MPTYTTNFNIPMPLVNSPVDANQWGTLQNQGAVIIDNVLGYLSKSSIGSTRPSYTQAGTFWVDNTTNPWNVNIYDGVQDVPLGTLDPTAHTFTPTGGVMMKIAEYTLSSVSYQDIPIVGYTSYRIVLQNVFCSVDVSGPGFLMSTDGGITFINTAGAYQWGAWCATGGTAGNNIGSRSDTRLYVSLLDVGNATNEGLISSDIWINNAGNNNMFTVLNFEGAASNGLTQYWGYKGFGIRVNKEVNNAVRFQFNNGIITQGKIIVYGIS
jgi:hypothetical protein